MLTKHQRVIEPIQRQFEGKATVSVEEKGTFPPGESQVPIPLMVIRTISSPARFSGSNGLFSISELKEMPRR